MRSFRTKSGSVYDVDGMMVRRRARGTLSNSERVSMEWREATSIQFPGVGHPIVIMWGLGADEHSHNPSTLQVGTDEEGALRTRMTITSPVVEVLDPPPVQ